MQRDVAGRVPWRMIVLAGLGGALEFYDFVLFGVFAPIIGATFFPSGNPLVQQMVGYAGFAIGYLARPIGGVVIAHFGDRRGRRGAFLGSVLVMSIATVAMGLLPGYATLGPAAPVLLLLLRLAQGFCLGAEFPGAVTYVTETVPERASFACGVVFTCVNCGALLATLINLALPPAIAASWGWRAAFLFGGVLGLIGFFVRRALAETPAFRDMRGRVAKLPLGDVLRAYPLPVIIGTATSAATAGFNGVLFVLLGGYLGRTLHYPPTLVAIAQNGGVIAYTLSLLATSRLAERVPRRSVLAVGSALLALGSWPFFAALAGGEAPIVLLVAVASLVAGICTGVFSPIVADLFPTRVRYSGVALAYNLSFTTFSGTVPLLATAAIAATGSLEAPAAVMAACAAIAFAGAIALRWFGGALQQASGTMA
jgi:MHS family proline/betaine transporter-like MFS transporter